MNTHNDGLLEPFPTNARVRSEYSLVDRLCGTSRTPRSKRPVPVVKTHNVDRFQRSMSTNLNDSTTSFAEIEAYSIRINTSDNDDVMGAQDALDDSSKSGFDPISVASVVGDKEEFRRLQEDLRNSRMITGLGTQQILNKYIESRRLVVEEKRQNDEELSKVKCFEDPPQSKITMGDTWKKRMSSLRALPLGNDSNEMGVIATLNRRVNSLRFDR